MTCGNFSTEKDTKNDDWLSSDDRLLITFNFMALRIKVWRVLGVSWLLEAGIGIIVASVGSGDSWRLQHWTLHAPSGDQTLTYHLVTKLYHTICWPDSIILSVDQTLSYHLVTKLYHTIWWPDSSILSDDQTLLHHLMTRLFYTIWWPDSFIPSDDRRPDKHY